MNELRLAVGRGGAHAGYTTILGNPGMGDYGKFQPGPGNSMGYDDLKVIEAKKFLQSVTQGVSGACTIDDAQSAAEVVSAAVASAASRVVGEGPRRHRRRPRRRAADRRGAEVSRPDASAVVVGGRSLGKPAAAVGPGAVNPTAVVGTSAATRPSSWASARSTRPWSPACSGTGVRFVAEPTDADLAVAVGAIVRADAVVDAAFLDRTPRMRVLARTGVGTDLVDLEAATARGIAVVVTPGSGTRAVAEGVLAHALALVKRLAPLTTLVRAGRWAERDAGGPTGDLDGATIGIIGYGRIGRRVGELAAAFGMRVLAYDPFAPPPADVACAEPGRAGRRERRPDPARAADVGEPPHGRRRVPRPDQARRGAGQLRPGRPARPRRGARRRCSPGSSPASASTCSSPSRPRTTRSSTTRASRSPPT